LKILILKPSSMGDVIQALPVLRLLKRHYPDSAIFWWVDTALAPLLEGDPDLAGVVRFERRRWRAPWRWPELWRSILWMREQRFDWVIDLQGLARSGLVAWLANGRRCIGLDESREGARGFYDIVVRQPGPGASAVDCYLSVLPTLGIPEQSAFLPRLPMLPIPPTQSPANSFDFTWLPSHPEIAAAVRQKWPVDTARWVVLQPGARWLNKRWPAESFAELAKSVAAARNDIRFAILGSQEDQSLGQIIARVAEDRCLDLTGRLSLPEMVEWIRLSAAMVTNDTGPMHVAAALGTPVVALFGPTDPRRTGPYGQFDHVLQLSLPCVPCKKSRCAYVKPMECLRALPVSLVAQALLDRLDGRRPAAK